MNSKHHDQLIALRELIQKQQQDTQALSDSLSFALGDLAETWTGRGSDSLQGVGQSFTNLCPALVETTNKLERANQKLIEDSGDEQVRD
jgi:hypothetical protein